MQSKSQRSFLLQAAQRYHAALPGSPAAEHLESRGLADPAIAEAVTKFRLGYVDEPLPGHEQYQGMLAIPYLRWSPGAAGHSVASIRFRRLDGGSPKYMTTTGDRPRLYNTLALLKHSPIVAITEGEIDAITADVAGIPAVGVPGAQAWKPHFREPFIGYEDVFILADGDDAGRTFAETVASSLPNARIRPMPPGQDVNSLVMSQGVQALKDRVK